MSVPTEQKALLLEARGDWEVRTVPVAEPGPGQRLVRVEATGLNPVDWKIRDWGLSVKSYPVVLGFDAAGIIVKLGDRV